MAGSEQAAPAAANSARGGPGRAAPPVPCLLRPGSIASLDVGLGLAGRTGFGTGRGWRSGGGMVGAALGRLHGHGVGRAAGRHGRRQSILFHHSGRLLPVHLCHHNRGQERIGGHRPAAGARSLVDRPDRSLGNRRLPAAARRKRTLAFTLQPYQLLPRGDCRRYLPVAFAPLCGILPRTESEPGNRLWLRPGSDDPLLITNPGGSRFCPSCF